MIAAGPQADVVIARGLHRRRPRAARRTPQGDAAAHGRAAPSPRRSRCARSATPCSSRTPTSFGATRRAGRWRPRAHPPRRSAADLVVAWRVCARTSSNAIVLANDLTAVGIGAGQQSRVAAAELAVAKAGVRAKGAAAASDAFFPFADGVEALVGRGRDVRRPARRLGQGRRGRGGRRRRGPRDAPHRRAALPALMAAILLDGERLASQMKAELTVSASPAWPPRARTVGLGTILVGDDVPSARYVALKHEDCAEVGIESHHVHLHADAPQADVLAAVRSFNEDPTVDAFLVQVPLPGELDEERDAVRRRPRQGRRRPAPREPRPAHARHARRAAVHAGGHRRAAGGATRCPSRGATSS